MQGILLFAWWSAPFEAEASWPRLQTAHGKRIFTAFSLTNGSNQSHWNPIILYASLNAPSSRSNNKIWKLDLLSRRTDARTEQNKKVALEKYLITNVLYVLLVVRNVRPWFGASVDCLFSPSASIILFDRDTASSARRTSRKVSGAFIPSIRITLIRFTISTICWKLGDKRAICTQTPNRFLAFSNSMSSWSILILIKCADRRQTLYGFVKRYPKEKEK